MPLFFTIFQLQNRFFSWLSCLSTFVSYVSWTDKKALKKFWYFVGQILRSRSGQELSGYRHINAAQRERLLKCIIDSIDFKQQWIWTYWNILCRFLLSDIFVFTPNIKRACCYAFSKCVLKLTDVNARIDTFVLLHAYYDKVCIWMLPFFFVWKSYSHIQGHICVCKYILWYVHTDTHCIPKN